MGNGMMPQKIKDTETMSGESEEEREKENIVPCGLIRECERGFESYGDSEKEFINQNWDIESKKRKGERNANFPLKGFVNQGFHSLASPKGKMVILHCLVTLHVKW